MRPSTADVMDSFRALPAEDRRVLLADMIRDLVAQNGRDATIRLLIADVFSPQTPLMQRQAETMAAFARLPEDVAATLLGPFDPASVRVEDCLSNAEVDRTVAGAGG